MRRLVDKLLPLASLALFIAALALLHHELHGLSYQDLVREIRAIPGRHLLLAMGFTVLSYVVLTGYDTLAFHYTGSDLPYRQIAPASFISYAFSNTLGFPLLTSAPIRFRLYSSIGATATEIGQVVAFCFLTFWSGLLVLVGGALVLEPLRLPWDWGLSGHTLRLVGIVLLVILAAYLAATVFKRGELTVGSRSIALPRPHIAVGQVVLSVLDWGLAASVLYVLLPKPAPISFLGFLGLFPLAQMAGILSQIPGGLGVFDSLILAYFTPQMDAGTILGSLLAYRLIYYLGPLILGAMSLAAFEARERRHHLEKLGRFLAPWVSRAIPHALAFCSFLGGVVLLFSGATPSATSRLAWLNDFIPLPIIEISHFLGSLVGVGLLLLARGLQRRLDAAYVLTAGLLAAGILASLLKGWDYEEAIVLAIMLLALLPCRREFYRKSALTQATLSPGWIATVAVVLGVTVWLVLFSFRQVEYSNELWWRFTLTGDAPRTLRATVGALGLLLATMISLLLRPRQPEPTPPDEGDLDRLRDIAATSDTAVAWLALLGDKQILFNDARSAFLMYGVEGRTWVAMGDPIGPAEERVELAWRYRELVDRHGGLTTFYQISERHLSLYIDLGLTLHRLGEVGRVPLADFSLEGRRRKELRYQVRRCEEKLDCAFEVVPTDGIPGLLPELRGVSDAWLGARHAREKSFSLGRFEPAYLARMPAAVVRCHGAVVAFANLWPGAPGTELSVDLMRHRPDAPPGTMDYLFTRLMVWGREQGYAWFNLGMTPFTGFERHELAPLWNRLGDLLFRYGETFYNFQGLRQYKEKFDPVWEPRYLACPGGHALPRILTNVATLIAGGVSGVFGK